MPPTENYQVMLYVSIDFDRSPMDVYDWTYHLLDSVPAVVGVSIDVGYIDNADYEVGA